MIIPCDTDERFYRKTNNRRWGSVTPVAVMLVDNNQATAKCLADALFLSDS